MNERAPWEMADSDGWARFLEGTADRPPLPFFDQAMDYVGTGEGIGVSLSISVAVAVPRLWRC